MSFHNPSSRDIARSAPTRGENNFFHGILYLFRITHNPRNDDFIFFEVYPLLVLSQNR